MEKTRLKKGIVIAGTLVTLGIVAVKFLPQSHEVLVQEVVKKEEKGNDSDLKVSNVSSELKIPSENNQSTSLETEEKELDKVVLLSDKAAVEVNDKEVFINNTEVNKVVSAIEQNLDKVVDIATENNNVTTVANIESSLDNVVALSDKNKFNSTVEKLFSSNDEATNLAVANNKSLDKIVDIANGGSNHSVAVASSDKELDKVVDVAIGNNNNTVAVLPSGDTTPSVQPGTASGDTTPSVQPGTPSGDTTPSVQPGTPSGDTTPSVQPGTPSGDTTPSVQPGTPSGDTTPSVQPGTPSGV